MMIWKCQTTTSFVIICTICHLKRQYLRKSGFFLISKNAVTLKISMKKYVSCHFQDSNDCIENKSPIILPFVKSLIMQNEHWRQLRMSHWYLSPIFSHIGTFYRWLYVWVLPIDEDRAVYYTFINPHDLDNIW